jgi:hypothetical protein
MNPAGLLPRRIRRGRPVPGTDERLSAAVPGSRLLPPPAQVPALAEGRPARPNTETAPIPLLVTGRPYMSTDALDPATAVRYWVRPAIGDSMGTPAAQPALYEQLVLEEPVEPGATALPYTAPGWAGLQMSRWIARGEWDDVYAIAEQGLGRNAADEAAGRRHSRTAIANGVRQWCAVIGRTELAEDLLRRTHELTVAARAQAAGGVR